MASAYKWGTSVRTYRWSSAGTWQGPWDLCFLQNYLNYMSKSNRSLHSKGNLTDGVLPGFVAAASWFYAVVAIIVAVVWQSEEQFKQLAFGGSVKHNKCTTQINEHRGSRGQEQWALSWHLLQRLVIEAKTSDNVIFQFLESCDGASLGYKDQTLGEAGPF